MVGISRLQRGPFCSRHQAPWPWDNPIELGSCWNQTRSFQCMSQDDFSQPTMDQHVVHWGGGRCFLEEPTHVLGKGEGVPGWSPFLIGFWEVTFQLLGIPMRSPCPWQAALWQLCHQQEYINTVGLGARHHSVKLPIERNQVGQTGHRAASPLSTYSCLQSSRVC